MRYTRFWLTYFAKAILAAGAVLVAIALFQTVTAPELLQHTLENLPTMFLFMAGFMLFIVQLTSLSGYYNVLVTFGCTRRELRHMNLGIRFIYSMIMPGVYLLLCAFLEQMPDFAPIPLVYIAVIAGLMLASVVFSLVSLTMLINRKLATVLSGIMGGLLGGSFSVIGISATFVLQRTPHTNLAIAILVVTTVVATIVEQLIARWALTKMVVK